eukprot:scaffold24786_cov161-Skeletonema_dohrnii-CCMP3373.AAC.2
MEDSWRAPSRRVLLGFAFTAQSKQDRFYFNHPKTKFHKYKVTVFVPVERRHAAGHKEKCTSTTINQNDQPIRYTALPR